MGVCHEASCLIVPEIRTEVADELEDILAAALTSNQYDNLKAAILTRKTASERSRLQHLLNMEELGDQRPSQLLRRMRQLLGDATSDADTSLLREIFLQRLPNNMVVVLAAAEDMPLERLADLADRVAEYSTHPVVATTSFQSRASDPAAAAPSQDIAARLSRLEKAIQDLQLPASRPSSSRRRSSSRRASPAAVSPVSERCWVYKMALGLPESTGTDRLFQLGIHNTLNEIAEAQRTSQLERLSGTNAGRRILENLGIGYHTQQGHKVTIPVAIRQTIRVDPIPRNVHPEYNRGRREARAKALLNSHSNNVDGETKISASVTCERAEEAEEIAVALALTDPACKTVLCDSRQVTRNFAKGRISLRAARIISQRQVHREPEPPTRLLWFPAHVGEVSEEHRNGNETAHARARELTNRTGDGRPWYSSKDRMTSYNEITKAFRLARRTLPPPSDKLDRAQAVALRQLQTRTYPNAAQYHRMFPEIYTTNTCKVCRKEVATLTHMLWDCTKQPHGANSGTLPPRLSASLCSPSLDDQLWAVQQACEAVKRQDFDAP
ncbi:hypothetical protein HPB47_010609 [Ixodes persulcatus]|uniref:Uncharacterized protein n=1 Tax=Ixodes persulcatus TaxID=34615 RepID=A0AC60NYL2_IXOPE|nr:hypothetical protein HPB47_010609 [Ixodes persulcatus]